MEKEKNAPLLLTLSSKKCSYCGEVKPTTEFARYKSKGKKWGFQSCCRECNKKMARKYRLENPEKARKAVKSSAIKRRYGITPEDKERMLKNQGYKCAICGEELFLFGDMENRNKVAHVDHNHETGEVRGLLCDKCNRGLGYFRDNTDYLLSAISYLKKNK